MVARSMRLDGTELRAAERAPFHPGRAAEIVHDGVVIGIVGEIHPAVGAAHGIEGRAIAGEVEVEPIVTERDSWRFDVPSSYPPQVFDLAFEVDSSVPAGTLLAAIDAAGEGMVEERTIFDVYEGDPIPEGRKSIAIKLTVRASDRTMSDEDVAPMRRRIVEAVEAVSGGTLRGSV
jgi:phenylalanyl-tRNA synthetase beta chain